MPFGLQPWHLLIAIVVIVLVMGPKRLPEIGQAMGKTLRGFKDELDAEPPEDAASVIARSVAVATPVAPVAAVMVPVTPPPAPTLPEPPSAEPPA